MPRGCAALALSALLLLPSCFTFGLWGFDLQPEREARTGRTEHAMRYDPDTEWSWELFGLRLLCTPFALALDCLTAPVQAFLWGDEDEHAAEDAAGR